MRISIFGILGLLIASAPVYADPVIYPAKGQSPEQQEKDKFECYGWAKNSSGFDPMSSSATATPQAQTKSGGAAKGAVAGAAAGAIFGNKSKHTRRSAAAGATIGGVSQASSNTKSQDQAQQKADSVAAQRNKYDKAHAACLEGKGYTVK